jgi:hypothetical protein
MRTIQIWTAEAGTTPAILATTEPLWFSGSGACVAEDLAAPPTADAIVLVAEEPSHGVCGVALVPDGISGRARLNGIRLGPGVHLLRHRDQMALDDQKIWFAIAAVPDEVAYDPDVHGESVFCLRTKARLKGGEAIVVCPGPPEAECGMLYRASAWGMGAPCHHCGAFPSREGWVPREPVSGSSLAGLFELGKGA